MKTCIRYKQHKNSASKYKTIRTTQEVSPWNESNINNLRALIDFTLPYAHTHKHNALIFYAQILNDQLDRLDVWFLKTSVK